MSYMNPAYGEFLKPSDVTMFLGHDLCTLDEPVRLKWKLSNGDWYFAVAKYYSKVGIAFERIQDHYKYVGIYPNTIIELEDGRTQSAVDKSLAEMCASFLEFFNGIVQEQRQQTIIQDEDEDFIVQG